MVDFRFLYFLKKVRENYSESERTLYDLYHERKEQEGFEKICMYFGRKYDLISYLYFILDPSRYLPLRSSIFDEVFKKLEINLQTSGRCSWDNYQEFITTVTAVRNAMKETYGIDDVDLIDAHSFLWTMQQSNFKMIEEPTFEIGSIVYHKDYGKGKVAKFNENKIYVDFDGKQRIFPFPEAVEKECLKLKELL